MEKVVSQSFPDNNYHSKEIVSNACSEIFENILRKTYEEENPFKSECESLINKFSSEGEECRLLLSNIAFDILIE